MFPPTQSTETTSRKQQASRRARNAICGGLLLLILVQVPFVWWIETRGIDLVDPEFGLRLQAYQRIASADPDQTLVVIGSSRTDAAIDTDLLYQPIAEGGLGVPAVNISISGGMSVAQHLLLRRLAHYGPPPRRVLLEVFPAALLGIEAEYFSPEFQFLPQRLRHCDLAVMDDLFPKDASRHRARWWRNHALFPLNTHGLSFWNSVFPLFQTEDLLRCAPHWRRHMRTTGHTPWPVKHPTEKQRANGRRISTDGYAKLLGDCQPDPRPVEIYRQTLWWCHTHDIEVVALVLMPESPWFREMYSEESWQHTRDVVAELGREFAVPVIDTRTWIDDEESFIDGHHLLPSATRDFTLRLWSECLRPTPGDAGEMQPK